MAAGRENATISDAHKCQLICCRVCEKHSKLKDIIRRFVPCCKEKTSNFWLTALDKNWLIWIVVVSGCYGN